MKVLVQQDYLLDHSMKAYGSRKGLVRETNSIGVLWSVLCSPCYIDEESELPRLLGGKQDCGWLKFKLFKITLSR